jgi:phage nucleotide-binding protein
MSLIKKPHEIDVQTKIKMLLYGQPGLGKTTMALSAPKPLLIDCDGGLHRVNIAHRCNSLPVTSYNDVLEVLKEDLSDYDTIVIDTGGKLLDFMASYIIQKNSKMGRSNGSLTLQGYGERKMEFSAFCKLVSSLGKHLIFVAHRETRTEGDDTRYVPQFGGSNYDALVTELDLVGYIEANGKQRTITFNGTSRNDGKNTCNLPELINIPTVVDSAGNGLQNTFIRDAVINPYLQRIEADKQLYAKYEHVIAEIKTAVFAVSTAEDANALIEMKDNFEHVGSSKAVLSQMLANKAKELGLTLKNGKYAA